MNHYDLSGRVAFVTGGGSGIGQAVTTVLQGFGAKVAVFDLVAQGGDVNITGDVTRPIDLAAGMDEADASLGPIDILVCSAGVPGASLKTIDVTDEEWNHVLAVNASGSFYAVRQVLPGMISRGYGRIVNVASIAGKEGNPMAAAYSASKAAVIAFTKSIAKDVAGTGVLVNCIAPAVIRTPILNGISQEHVDYMLQRIPLGRMGDAHEAALLIAFLASDDVSFSTGACFDLSGGRATY
jgi:NAD(P)-dependent dehydrogenase (short-subunit alcohol dehydrogenase family)